MPLNPVMKSNICLSKQLSMCETSRSIDWERRNRILRQERSRNTEEPLRMTALPSLMKNRRYLSKQLSMLETSRDIAWERRRRQILRQERGKNGIPEANGITDEDLNELKGCIELGFGFNEEAGQQLCNTLPALDLYFAVNRQLSPSPDSTPHSIRSSSISSLRGRSTASEDKAKALGASSGMLRDAVVLKSSLGCKNARETIPRNYPISGCRSNLNAEGKSEAEMEQLKTIGRELAMGSQGGFYQSKEFLDLVKSIGEDRSKAEEDRIVLGEIETFKRRVSEPDIPKRKVGLPHLAYSIFFNFLMQNGKIAPGDACASHIPSPKRSQRARKHPRIVRSYPVTMARPQYVHQSSSYRPVSGTFRILKTHFLCRPRAT
ncbi:putative ankyrin repeat-containing protein [Hibiscus syriacus]|uniref:Ankyrin repeat-containing protein n=1 Tax=Hibiscus syriacus TaxID=106335 RepID=A0A6A3AHT0_HIBSY|nr:putative ankyrin repeat-containing protein [Hibiscus syriacus]